MKEGWNIHLKFPKRPSEKLSKGKWRGKMLNVVTLDGMDTLSLKDLLGLLVQSITKRKMA